ncbi:MAG: taurine dioxygenase [Acidimicrobiia bacterium]|nr:taurine dioxygenase [Acidimicrobiia bacterium]
MAITIEPKGGTIGATVTDIDLRRLDDSSFATLLDAWYTHLVLFFPGQDLSPAEHRDFAARFGELEVHPLTEKLDGVPEVTLLHSERGGRADVWHTDVTFSDSPPIAAVLRQLTGPAVGGDTMWANQYLAFDTLSAPMRSFCRELTAIHTAWSQGRPDLSAERPVVIEHPATGRSALAVNRLFTRRIPQLTPEESDALLGQLFDHGERPEFTVRWSWTPGDVVIWDNRCTRHHAIGDYDAERVMHRVTVLGDYRAPGGPSRWTAHEPGRLSARSAYAMLR